MSKSEQQSRCALPSTRRQFLKMTSAAAAVSSLSCWTQALAKTDLDALGAKPAETLDKSVKVVNTYHEIHCHGQCMLKAHVNEPLTFRVVKQPRRTNRSVRCSVAPA